MVIFQCQDSFDGILCGVYDAWTSRLGHKNVKLELADRGNIEMFAQYRMAEVSDEKRDKVIQAILSKIGQESYEALFHVSLSMEEEKADKIYRYLIYGFHVGPGVIDMLQIPAVYEVFRLSRYIGHEAHLLTGFVRFSQTAHGILLGRIGPKNDVLVLLAPHFADRLSGENWILYDENREKAVLHLADREWFVVKMDTPEWKEFLEKGSDEEMYESLWRVFHRSIAIRERVNLKSQMNHLSLRYRPYMTEFKEET